MHNQNRCAYQLCIFNLNSNELPKTMKQFLFTTFIGLMVACTPSKTEDKTEVDGNDLETGIRLTKAPASPAYEDAALQRTGVEIVQNDSSFTANFQFEVTNYELGVQTADAADRGIANSGKGQHIHVIIDNDPYSAHYEPMASRPLTAGNHVVLAFLSRSYHESVKNPTAFYIGNVKVGEGTTEPADLSAPHLFYSRPKGTYSGVDTEKLLLDFYLLNTTISPEGNSIRATIDGEEFMIDEWAPYYIEGLDKGIVTIKLELLDAKGNLIPGPFNTVERKVTLQ